jgi:VanZ family protein
MSALKDSFSSRMSPAARVAAWILAIAIVVLSIVPRDLRPETDLPHYLEHFLIFLITGIAFGLGYGRNLGLLGVFLFLFAGLVEIAQLFQSSRHARISDFLIDTLALWIGLITVSLSNEFWKRFGDSNDRKRERSGMY